MHLKRHKSPKKWPIKRKGTKYIVKPNFSTNQGVPVLIALRDMLELAKNRKEVKKAIREKQVLLNDRKIKDEKNNVLLFDVISIVPTNKNYKLQLSNFGKFMFEEVKDAKWQQKIVKVVDKKILNGKKVQINLNDGHNFLYNGQLNINDSVVFGFKEKKIIKVLQLKEKAKAIVYAGKHAGKEGVIESLDNNKKMIELDVGGSKINVLIKQIMVVE
ncbi:MAG: hypothetical protein AABW51_00585 [Nanoarchaeota archaeon]